MVVSEFKISEKVLEQKDLGLHWGLGYIQNETIMWSTEEVVFAWIVESQQMILKFHNNFFLLVLNQYFNSCFKKDVTNMLYSHTKNYLLCLASYKKQLFIRRNYNHLNKTLLLWKMLFVFQIERYGWRPYWTIENVYSL